MRKGHIGLETTHAKVYLVPDHAKVWFRSDFGPAGRDWRQMKRVYELDVYKLAEELSDSESKMTEYKAIVDKLGPKLNAFINSTKA